MKAEKSPPYSRLSADDRRFLDQLKDVPPLGALSIQQERNRMRQGQSSAYEDSLVTIEEFATTACPVHIIRPLAPGNTALPIIFYLHGGGWALGDLQTHMQLVCKLADKSHCAVVFIDYPRAPEHPFPAPLQACADAIADILSASGALFLNSERFLLVGDSSGGNLVMGVAQVLGKADLNSSAGLVLLYPVTDHIMDTPSHREFEDNPNLSRHAMEWFWDHYMPDQSMRSNSIASPLRASFKAFAGLPPVLIITCEYDILRDEGEQLAALLTGAGVNVTAVRWLGALHGFLVTEQLSASTSARNCVDFVAQYCKKAAYAKSSLQDVPVTESNHRIFE